MNNDRQKENLTTPLFWLKFHLYPPNHLVRQLNELEISVAIQLMASVESRSPFSLHCSEGILNESHSIVPRN